MLCFVHVQTFYGMPITMLQTSMKTWDEVSSEEGLSRVFKYSHIPLHSDCLRSTCPQDCTFDASGTVSRCHVDTLPI